MATSNAKPETDLRVLHIIETLGAAGAEQLLVNILPELAVLGVHCEVAALWPPYTLAEELEKRGIPVHRIGLKQPWNALKSVPQLKRLVAEKKISILHAHLFFSMFHSAMTWPFLPRVSRVLTLHNQAFVGFPAHSPSLKLRRAGEAWLTKHCFDYLTAVSDSVGDHYAEQLGIARCRIHYVPNGLPVDLAPDASLDLPAIRKQYGVPAGGYLIVSPARLIEQKGHKFLFDALLQLRSRGILPFTRIVGDGPLRESFLTLIRENKLESQVGVVRALPHAALFPLIQAADLVVLPSIFEGFGIAQCECMLLEKPVIGTRVGGFLQIIEDGESGVLVPPGDGFGLATAIEGLLRDPARRTQIGLAARRRIITAFSAQRVAHAYLQIYRQLAESRP